MPRLAHSGIHNPNPKPNHRTNAQELLGTVLSNLNARNTPEPQMLITKIQPDKTTDTRASLTFRCPDQGGKAVTVSLPSGGPKVGLGASWDALSGPQRKLFSGAMESLVGGRHICLLGLNPKPKPKPNHNVFLGPRGEGKSTIARAIAESLDYSPLETIFLYADMTARDLLQRRTTGPTGDTP